jgi:hypothetical protein
MKEDRNMEDPVSRKRLRRKVLERWENEGGKTCTDPVSQSGPTLQSETSAYSHGFGQEDRPPARIKK